MDTQRRVVSDALAFTDANQFRMFPDLIVAHQGHSLLLADPQGMLGGGRTGLYHHKTRFLSTLRVQIDGRAPAFVSANTVDAYSTTAYYLAPAPVAPGAGLIACGPEVLEKGVELQINRFV